MSTPVSAPSAASRVLIVDDDRGLRTLIERSLRFLKITPAQADCGQAALEWLASNEADLILLDLRLPDMPAEQLIEAVTNNERKTDFVIITGYGDERVAVDMMKRGARDYLMKDEVFLERLPSVVDQILGDLSRERRLKEAEAALSILEMAVRHMTDAVIIVASGRKEGVHNEVVYINPAVERLFRVDSAAMRCRPLHELLAGAESKLALELVERSVESGQPCGDRVQLGQAGRGSFPAEIKVAPVRDSSGHLTHSVISLRDVTEQDRLERQYQQAQRMEALGQLAGGVAHDFNNVLTVIMGHTELLALDVGEEYGESLQQIQFAAKHATSLTSQLLAFTRQQVSQRSVFDLRDKIAQTHRMVERVIGENIELKTIPSQAPLIVNMDPAQVEQVIMNLVINSRDALSQGGQIRVSTSSCHIEEGVSSYRSNHPMEIQGFAAPRSADLDPGHYAVLAVSDDGEGMSEQTRMRIFEPFFTTKGAGEGGGTGLGLATVYGIVCKSGGAIDLDTELGKGTTFRVFFPMRGASELAHAEQASEDSEVSGGNERILVVEDETAVRQLIITTLEAQGYAVTSSESPAEALRLTAASADPVPFDLILTDMVMPGGSGLGLVEELRPTLPDAKVVFVSGYANSQLTTQDLERLDAIFLQKPFTPKELARLVRRALDQK